MLTKEYRIPLPLTVEEYRIAQLYMIAKKSREESKGADSGVEILVNEPYEDGPGGCGQYTHKIYHVGSHLPSWFKGLLPKSALTVEEKAWNAYPYTKTRFSCPFVQKFSLEIETYYCEDGGHQENVFNLTGSDMRNRIVDVIDVVKDQLHGTDYARDEDPRIYVSQKTGRGPLSEEWIAEYWEECKDKKMPLPNGKAIMSAYKLCKVEFHYWGMQSKIERFIQDIALRKTMLRAHRQAWAWQDEWFGLTMEDIREIEKETQEALKRKMAAEKQGYDDDEGENEENENENENNENERHARESSTRDSRDSRDSRGSRDSRESSVGCLEQEREQPSRGASSSSSTSSANVLQQQNYNKSTNSQHQNYPGPSNSSSNKLSHTSSSSTSSSNKPSAIKFSVSDMSDVMDSTETTPVFKNPPSSRLHQHPHQHQHQHRHHSSRSGASGGGGGIGMGRDAQRTKKQSSAKQNLNSPGASSNKSLELLASWRMEGLMRRESESGSEDEFFDCCDGDDEGGLTKWSSLDLIPQIRPGSGRETLSSARDSADARDSIFSQSFLQRASMRDRSKNRAFSTSTSQTRGSSCDRDSDSPIMFRSSFPSGGTSSSTANSSTSCPTTVLCLVIHAGSCLDTNVNADFSTKKSDVTTFRGAFESVIRQHYPSMLGHVSIKLVPAPAICTDALGILSSLSPYSFDVFGTDGSKMNESVPIGAIPLLATSQHDNWENAVGKMVITANNVYQEFLKSESGRGFSGQVVFIGDSMGSVLAYDALTKHSYSPQDTQATDEELPTGPADHTSLQVTGTPDRRRSSSSVSDSGNVRLDFEVSDFFMFGSPLGIILAHRKVQTDDKNNVQLPRPCHQVYNLFHPTDPSGTRLEPLSSSRFSAIPPMNVPRYAKYPLGDGQPYHLLECIQCNPHLFSESGIPVLGANSSPATASRRLSDVSIQSGMCGLLDALPAINLLTQKWWGNKRVDYALYCPEALQNFPPHALPHLFHASYWESTDAIAFILRQIGFQDPASVVAQDDAEIRLFTPNQPREKWIKKRTSVKLKNVSANHRANDVIAKDGLSQILRARFAYGPLDLVGLTGEKVDIYVMKDPPVGEWCQLATEITDKNGRITYTIPPDKSLGYGIYPIKMIVRGDHTCCDFYLGVVPSNTECVVFSIDGSFTASVSVTGRDPRVRGGAVDVVRHWQELGYLIIYVTGRPDMQHRKVVSWLAQHNFPHGFVSFADGLSTDFLQHKTDYLKSLVQDHRLVVHAAYGSSKDIAVYTSMGITPDKIFIVGKVAKKQQTQATILNEGYSSHLNILSAHGGSRAAHGNARMVIPRGYFGLPGQPMSMRRRRSAKRATSFPVMSQTGTESISRGLSPRPTVKSHLSNND